jgi:hypothetical protein
MRRRDKARGEHGGLDEAKKMRQRGAGHRAFSAPHEEVATAEAARRGAGGGVVFSMPPR